MGPIFQRRSVSGVFKNLFKELKEDLEQFFRYLRMSPERFNNRLSLVEGSIIKRTTQCGIPISPEKRLALTLRLLASDELQESLSYSFRVGMAIIGLTTVTKIIAKSCNIFYIHVKDECLSHRRLGKNWKLSPYNMKNSGIFYMLLELWMVNMLGLNVPSSVAPCITVTYKGYFSRVLLLMCDVNYSFILLNFRSYDSNMTVV